MIRNKYEDELLGKLFLRTYGLVPLERLELAISDYEHNAENVYSVADCFSIDEHGVSISLMNMIIKESSRMSRKVHPRVGGMVAIRADTGKSWEPHLFKVFSVEEDHITGMALTGSLAGAYGEPDKELIWAVRN